MARARHVYGRALTFRYIPIANEESYIAYELVSARIYGPNAYPSDSQIEDAALATTGHLGNRITSWSLVNEEGTGDSEYKIVFDAITDTTPANKTDSDLFYVALNYRAQSGGDILRDVEQVEVFRPDGLTSKIRVSAQDVWDLESNIELLDPQAPLWTEAKIEAAIEELLSRLEGRGYSKRRLFNLEKLNAAARRLACSYCCFNLISVGTEWAEKAKFWREQSDILFEIAKVGLDIAETDTPQPSEKVATGPAIWSR